MTVLIEHKFELIENRKSITNVSIVTIMKDTKQLADGSFRHQLIATQYDGTIISQEVTGKGVTVFVDQSKEESESNRTTKKSTK